MYQFKSLKLSKKGFIWWNIYYLLLANIPNKKRKKIQQETNIRISWRLERKSSFCNTHKASLIMVMLMAKDVTYIISMHHVNFFKPWYQVGISWVPFEYHNKK